MSDEYVVAREDPADEYAYPPVKYILHLFGTSGSRVRAGHRRIDGPCVLCGSPHDPERMTRIRWVTGACETADWVDSVSSPDAGRACRPEALDVLRVAAS